MADSLDVKKPSFFRRVCEVVREFSQVDTNYIEPQRFNYMVMLQSTISYESYTMGNGDGQELTLSPEGKLRIGPYVGWRWLVLGYTIDIFHPFDKNLKQDFDISLYSNQIGIDIFYRNTGDNYKIRLAKLGNEVENKLLKGVSFTGFESSIKGFNIYYIMNHKKFSYPAAFSQSTCQRISCGSPLVGIGYTRHTLDLDVKKLNKTIIEHMGDETDVSLVHESMVGAKVYYTDISLYGGYAYNWVFARNCLAAASLSLGLGYKQSIGEVERDDSKFRDFSFRNFNIDGVGRFGLVWNNTRWFVSSSIILHAYTYSRSQFSVRNFFGNININFGYNFGRIHPSPKKKKSVVSARE